MDLEVLARARKAIDPLTAQVLTPNASSVHATLHELIALYPR
jgi:hypothetical protein